MIGLLVAVPAIPAQAGDSHRRPHSSSANAAWIPAFAGMTVRSGKRIGVDRIIPARAGMTTLKQLASFPRRRESSVFRTNSRRDSVYQLLMLPAGRTGFAGVPA